MKRLACPTQRDSLSTAISNTVGVILDHVELFTQKTNNTQTRREYQLVAEHI